MYVISIDRYIDQVDRLYDMIGSVFALRKSFLYYISDINTQNHEILDLIHNILQFQVPHLVNSFFCMLTYSY